RRINDNRRRGVCLALAEEGAAAPTQIRRIHQGCSIGSELRQESTAHALLERVLQRNIGYVAHDISAAGTVNSNAGADDLCPEATGAQVGGENQLVARRVKLLHEAIRTANADGARGLALADIDDRHL